jgi:hypothetical protein
LQENKIKHTKKFHQRNYKKSQEMNNYLDKFASSDEQQKQMD